jgi:hypothetical protein
MDNYHEFRCIHDVQIKSGDYIGRPIMFSKLEVLSLIEKAFLLLVFATNF